MKVDVLIIGSGVSGTALASRILTDKPNASILLLEAGSKVKMKDFASWQKFLITKKFPYEFCEDLPYPQSNDTPGENLNVGKTIMPLKGFRLIIYGGGTVHWGGWSFRLKPEDFRLKTNTGHGIDWPISYEELEPYYCEAEHHIGVAGDSEDNTCPRTKKYPYRKYPYTLSDSVVAKAMDELKIKHMHMPIARYGISNKATTHVPCMSTGTCKYCPFGARFVAANNLDDMMNLQNFPNLQVEQNILVEEILMESKRRARGVRCIDKNTNKQIIIDASHIVIAAGVLKRQSFF